MATIPAPAASFDAVPAPAAGGVATRTPTRITIQGAVKHFGTFPALAGVDLEIAPGELLALLGPSGSGKTTLLRALAGLEALDAGRIAFDGQETSGLSVQARRAGFVFQHYALFGQMTVAENIAFGLTVRPRAERPDKAEIARRVKELLDVVQLSGLGERYPPQLSGGQKQRVALARALAIEPRVLLLDEPFGALDARVRKDLRQWLRRLHEQTGVTTVFVTHDQEEALELADRVVVMNRGRIEQAGSTAAVYEAPATPFVFDFLGAVNILPGVFGSDGEVRVGPGRFAVGTAGAEAVPGPRVQPGPVDVYVRPHDIRLVEDTSPGLLARVERVQRTGPVVRAALVLEDVAAVGARPVPLALELSHLDPLAAWLKPDARVRVAPARFSLFPRRDDGPAPTAPPATLPDVPANSVPEQRGGRGRV